MSNGRTVRYREKTDIYAYSGGISYGVDSNTINYFFPVVPGSTYTVTMDEIGNRLRAVHTNVNPCTITKSVTVGITNIVIDPKFAVGYSFSYKPEEYGYIVIYVSNAGERPKISVVSDGAGGDLEYEIQAECVQNAGGTSQEAIIEALGAGFVLATVSTRSATTYPSDWTLLHASEPLAPSNLNQRMAFLMREVQEGETASICITQEWSERIYINLLLFIGAPGIYYTARTGYVNNTSSTSFSVPKKHDSPIIWGVSAPFWNTSSSKNPWKCADLASGAVSVKYTGQPRQANFVDAGNAGDRVFTATAETAAIIDYVVIGAPYDRKYLVRSNETLYTVSDGALHEIGTMEPTADVFCTHGVDDLPNGALLLPLTNPEVLYWQDSQDELPELDMAVRGIPPLPQMFTSKPISMTHESIAGIDHVEIDSSGDVRFAISFDCGVSWKAYNGEYWYEVTDTVPGMLASTFTAITPEQWADVTVLGGEYQMRFWLPSVTSYVKKAIIHYINP